MQLTEPIKSVFPLRLWWMRLRPLAPLKQQNTNEESNISSPCFLTKLCMSCNWQGMCRDPVPRFDYIWVNFRVVTIRTPVNPELIEVKTKSARNIYTSRKRDIHAHLSNTHNAEDIYNDIIYKFTSSSHKSKVLFTK